MITHTLSLPAGQRLDAALAATDTGLSRARWQQLLKQGQVQDEAGTPLTNPAQILKTDTTVMVTLPPPAPMHLTGEDIPLDILFEDAHLLVLNKPAGLTVHPGAGQRTGTLVQALLHHCQGGLSGIGGVERPGIIHRLDKDTTGIMVVAKTDVAHAGLASQFEARTIHRRYLALVAGVPTPPVLTIDANIHRHPTARTKMAVVPSGGRPAQTTYKIIESFGQTASLVACKLHTGRTHQIRVHLAHRGHPVLGDPLYGGTRPLKGALPALNQHVKTLGRQMLHAAELGFVHPVTQDFFSFNQAPPADFTACQAMLNDMRDH